jgi:dTDP-4-dehydrorhamnose reductase
VEILVIGGNGQLGRHLREELAGACFWDRTIVDLADIPALERKLSGVRPAAIVNAAAYTAVDKAESEPELAWRLNAEAPAVLARAAHHMGVPLVHVSTDYVFDGRKAAGYIESDAVGPLNVYGRSKLGGELAVASLCTNHWILRTAWVFSEHGSNFPKTMLRLAAERPELRVVDDQRGRPTYAGDLARCIAGLLAAPAVGGALPWGLHHVGGGPVVTWKQFAAQVLEGGTAAGLIARAPALAGIRTEEYPTPATRPRNSVLLTRDTTALHTRAPFDWEAGLQRMLTALKAGREAPAN